MILKSVVSRLLTLTPTSPSYKTNEAHINELELEQETLSDDITKLQEQITDLQEEL